MTELTMGAAGQPVTVQVGERLGLTLAETATTGYRWRVSDDCLALMTTESDESVPGGVQPGAAGEHRWVFLAKAVGRCELRVVSARSWAGGGEGKVVVFPVTVVGR